MSFIYVIKRIGLFFLIVWLAATVNFFVPRLSGQDPVKEKLLQLAMQTGYVPAGIIEMSQEYEKRFGLDRPLWVQYLSYVRDVSRFDLNYSISNYPRKVSAMIAESVPWTIGLLATATVLSFTIGTLLGAFLGWPRAPRWLSYLMPPLMAFHAIPFFLLGLIFMYLFSFRIRLLPMFGGYTTGTFPGLNLAFVVDVVRHAILPAFSIILVAAGGWALAMRGMMVTVQGEDYVIFADAMGLKPRTIFLHYAIRNAILPQITALALSLGYVVSGAVLVEVIFAYPGIGSVLYNAIREADHFLIQGIIFCVIVTLGLTLLIVDLLYPLLDPRITYRGA